MSEEQVITLTTQIVMEQEDDEALARLTRQLRREMLQFDVRSVEFVSTDSDTPGKKGIDMVLIGWLTITLAPIVLPKVLEFLHDWAFHYQNQRIKIRFQATKESAIEVEVPATLPQEELRSWINTVIGAVTERQIKGKSK